MNDKSKKTQKLKARLPGGLPDRGPAELAATRQMVEKIREVFELYGFEPVETPAMEYTDALGKFLPDQDRPNEGVFSFQDDDKQWISLRYDLTAPLARYVAENFYDLPIPYRSYRVGYVYRNEKPDPGRFRQFMQFDADTVGSASPAADAEMCMMAADTMEALGIPRGSYVVKVNNRKVLDGILETLNLDGEENAQRRLIVLRAIDKLDRLGRDGVAALLGAGRRDQSGDVTKGANLNGDQIDFLLNFLRPVYGFSRDEDFGTRPLFDMERIGASNYIDNFGTLNHLGPMIVNSQSGYSGIKELGDIIAICESAGYGSKRIRLDASVVRGLEYYTGPVFEIELTMDLLGDKGKPVSFGSVGGGGRYDGLVSRFRGEPAPATGFSIGVSRLQTALTKLRMLDQERPFGPVVVTVFSDRDAEIARQNLIDAQQKVQVLRNAKIRAELYLGNPKNMSSQLKYADKRNSPCVIIQGSNEKARGEVQIKDCFQGALLTDVGDGDRGEYLKRQAEAQFAVPEVELLEAVIAVLRRNKVKWN